ncbi:MAG: multicopper oxidase family protein [Actinomycetales bacterium]|nr:multicopper oxidase family protein [Actinomycetales bacterium]
MQIARRTALAGLLGVVAVGSTSGCTTTSTGFRTPGESLMAAINRVEAARFSSNVTTKLDVTQRLAKVDLGEGSIVEAKTFNGLLPGAPLRANYGDLVKLTQKNELAEATSIHIHGLALRNDADGVPMVTQDEVGSGTSFTQTFKAPHPGTYWYHSHTGLQPEEGLYGSFIIDDPSEAGAYDREWILMLDDWTVGIGKNPEQILLDLKAATSSDHDMGGMNGMNMGGMDMSGMGGMNMAGMQDQFGLGMGMSDVTYPAYIINGRVAEAPEVFDAKAGERIRLRIINAGSDTAFVFGVEGHTMTVTHTDGFSIKEAQAQTVLLGMGERIDAVVTVQDGAFSAYAIPVGKTGTPARAVLRTGTNPTPPVSKIPTSARSVTQVSDLSTTSENRLTGSPSATLSAMLMGSMVPYSWNINGNTDMHATLFELREGETVDLNFMNHSMMFHPMHFHGHTFQVIGANGQQLPNGPRKDTVIVKPMTSVTVRIQADNPGDWALHCHNSYHMDSGMMGVVRYKL